MPPEALPKERRLAKRREFVHVYETGRKLFSRYAVLFFAPNDSGHARIGITVTSAEICPVPTSQRISSPGVRP